MHRDQLPLPLAPGNSEQIGKTCFFIVKDEETYTYFVFHQHYGHHARGDKKLLNFYAAMLVHGGAKISDVSAALSISSETVRQAKIKLRADGPEAFHRPRKARGRSRMDGELIAKAERKLASGKSIRKVAAELEISYPTLRDNIEKRVVANPKPCAEAPQSSEDAVAEIIPDPKPCAEAPQSSEDAVAEIIPGPKPCADAPRSAADAVEESETALPLRLIGPSERDRRDRLAPMGRAAHDVKRRTQASRGELVAAAPLFNEAHSAVTFGGVLTALPLLIRAGLLKFSNRRLSLPNGFFGLDSILLLLAFLALVRVRNVEQINALPPGDLGILIGIDRCPRDRTLRLKIRLLSKDSEQLWEWQLDLSKYWDSMRPYDANVKHIDGHGKKYTGDGNVPKGYAPGEQLCPSVQKDYWVNGLDGSPGYCIHTDLDPGLQHAIEKLMLDAEEKMGVLGPHARSLLLPVEVEKDGKKPSRKIKFGKPNRSVKPALTVVFDREGWSPNMFGRMGLRGVAIITWVKGDSGPPWPKRKFRKMEVTKHLPGNLTITSEKMLAQKIVELPNGLVVRKIRILMDDDRQKELVTTDMGPPMARIVGLLTSRWSQESFFKHMKWEFGLGNLPARGLVDLDPQTLVNNPRRRELKREIARAAAERGKLLAALGELDLEAHSDEGAGKKAGKRGKRSKSEAEKKTERDILKGKIEKLDRDIEEKKSRRADVPEKIEAGELDESERPQALPVMHEKNFHDIVRTIACVGENMMMGAIGEKLIGKRRARNTLKNLFRSKADIIPDHKKGILRVRVIGSPNDAADDALKGLFKELNQTKTIYPGTNLRMVYELPILGRKSRQNSKN